MTDIAVYEPPAQLEQYQARLAMTPEQAKALDDQVRLCTKAVLREGTDFGVIPGGGDRQILLKPGAEKLLQWFGFGFTCDRVEIDTDEDGVRQGVTYRCTVTKQLPDGRIVGVTTCEGYAGYDELKFFKPVTDAERHKAEARERGWAKKDGRPADPTKWKNLQPYRAPWNTVIKMAQKRAIVGAAITATAAAGLFGTEEDNASPVADDGSTWYEQALEAALTFTDHAAGDELYVKAAYAHRDGLCTRDQKDRIQNRVRQRQDRLKTARPVEVEDLARAAASPSPAAAPQPPQEAAGEALIPGPAPASTGPLSADAEPAGPGTPGDHQHQRLVGRVQGHMKRLGYACDDTDRDERMRALNQIARTEGVASTSDFDDAELQALAAELGRHRNRNSHPALIAAAGGDGDG